MIEHPLVETVVLLLLSFAIGSFINWYLERGK